MGRKRVAHPSAAESVVRSHRPKQPAQKVQLPQQKMYDRWRSVKEAAAKKNAERRVVEDEKSLQSEKSSVAQETKMHSGNIMSQASACNAQVNGNGINQIRS